MFFVVAVTVIVHSLDNSATSRPLGPNLVSDVLEQNQLGVQLHARCWWILLEGLYPACHGAWTLIQSSPPSTLNGASENDT